MFGGKRQRENGGILVDKVMIKEKTGGWGKRQPMGRTSQEIGSMLIMLALLGS